MVLTAVAELLEKVHELQVIVELEQYTAPPYCDYKRPQCQRSNEARKPARITRMQHTACGARVRIERQTERRATTQNDERRAKVRVRNNRGSETTGGASVSRVRWFGHDRSRIHRDTKPLLLWPSAPTHHMVRRAVRLAGWLVIKGGR